MQWEAGAERLPRVSRRSNPTGSGGQRSLIGFLLLGCLLGGCADGHPSTAAPATTKVTPATSASTSTTITPPSGLHLGPADPTMVFTSLQRGVVATARGVVDFTLDGGVSWQTSVGSAHVIGLDFATRRAGWAVTARPVSSGQGEGPLLRTIDGGVTWTRLPVPTTGALFTVDFVNELDGFGLSGNGDLLHTSDAGVMWKRIAAPGPVSDLCFVSDGKGWLSSDGAIYRFAGGHVSMSLPTTAIDPGPWGFTPTPTLSCDGSEVLADYVFVVASGQTPTAVARLDGGRWKVVMDPSESGFNRTSALDAQTGAFGATGKGHGWWLGSCPQCQPERVSLTTTSDAGAAFQRRIIESSGPSLSGLVPDGVSFIDARHGWVLLTDTPQGRSPQSETRLLATDDGGATWRLVTKRAPGAFLGQASQPSLPPV